MFIKLWEAGYRDLLDEFRGKLVPPDHAVNLYIHGIVSRILQANNLGSLQALSPHTKMSADSVLFGTEDREFDETSSSVAMSPTTLSNKKWNLLVVHDSKRVNAMATPGTSHYGL